MTTECNDPRLEDPEEIFAEFLQRIDAGEEIDFEEVVAAHPERADELRRFHAEWNRWASVLEGAAPGPQSIEGAPPTAPDAGDPGPRISSEVLRQFAIGSEDGHRYRFRSHVSSGGQGSILKVWDTELRRQLAMKLMLGEKAIHEGETQAQYERKLGRFLDEAQITGQLDHPGVIPVHELGVSSSGRAFFTMRFVRGRHFGEVIDELHGGEAGQTLVRCVGVLQRICETMAFAHSRGIVHRDLKPENVMVGPFGEVYVMDWGLARVLGKEDQRDLRIVGEERDLGSIDTVRRDARAEDPDSPLFTADGAVVGTPMYMSPEQARGELEVVGPKSDIYTVGAMIHHLLVGHAPYLEPGTNASAYTIWRRVMEGPPQTIATVAPNAPEELVAICVKAMARDVDERYESMKDLLEDLRAYSEGRVVQAHRTGAWVELRKWVARNRSTAAALAAAVFLAIAAPITVAAVVSVKNDMITQQQAELHLQVANLAAQRGDGHAVLKSLEAAGTAGYHDPVEIAWRRADARIVTHQHEEALAELEALCDREDLGEHAGAIYLRRGHLLLYTWDESTEGLEWTERAIEAKLGPADHELAMSYTAGTFREAMEHCQRALEEEPFNYLANTHLLSLLVFTGDHENAARQALAIEKLFPDDPTPVVYQVLRSALEGRLEIDALDDQAVVDRLGEDNVSVLRGIAGTLHALMPHLRGEVERPPNMLALASTVQTMLSGLQGENQPSHRRFGLVGTPAMPLLRDSFRPTLAAVLNLLIQGNPQADTVLRLLLQTEDEPLIEHFFGEQYTGFEHDDWVATLERVAEMNGDSIIWLVLAYNFMLELDSAGDRPAMVAMMRDAEYAFRRAYEAPSILPGIPDVAGTMMVYSQALLGCFGWGLSDPAMLESAHRNLEKMVHTEGLDPMYRHYLQISSTQMERPDLSLLLWRQALREHPEAKKVRQQLASAALGVGHWAEAIEIAEGILEEDATDEVALGVKTKALQRGRKWLSEKSGAGETAAEQDG